MKLALMRACLITCSSCSKDSSVLTKAFITYAYVRPILEYCSSVWSPIYSTVANISEVEAVQRNFTKFISGLSDCGYSERLYNLTLRKARN
jgi:hypothetical protein